jgi:hypothetical protein
MRKRGRKPSRWWPSGKSLGPKGLLPLWSQVRALWLLIWWPLETYMVINFRACGISWGARKLAWTLTLNLKKKKNRGKRGYQEGEWYRWQHLAWRWQYHSRQQNPLEDVKDTGKTRKFFPYLNDLRESIYSKLLVVWGYTTLCMNKHYFWNWKQNRFSACGCKTCLCRMHMYYFLANWQSYES